MYINVVNLNFNSLSYNNNPNKIILHHAESSNCSIEDINSWHKAKGWAGVGYHYFIRKDGSIYKGRPENAQGAQCSGQNCESIGICFEGSYMTETMPQEQFNAGLELIVDIRSRRGSLPIYGHKELLSTDCPGTNFPLDGFKNGIPQPVSQPQPQVVEPQIQGRYWVGRIQQLCNEYGMNILVDNLYGSETEGAIRRLPLAGIPYTSPEATRFIQERLGIIIDGIFLDESADNLYNWQVKHGLDADKICGFNSYRSLALED